VPLEGPQVDMHTGTKGRLFLAICATLLVAFWTTPALAGDVILEWDPHTEPNLAGYKLYYGRTSRAYDHVIDVGLVTTYRVTGLPGGTYYFAVTAYAADGTESGYSNEVSTTLAASAPAIAAVTASGVTSGSASVSWTTDTPSDSQVEYGTTNAYGSSTALDATLGTSHSQVLSGLGANTLYHFRVRSRDAAGNPATSDDFTFTTLPPPDTTPPVISAVTSSEVSGFAATITWTTDEASDSQVEYGPSIGYGSSSVLDTRMLTSHSVTLSGLAVGTLHHYRVKSKDAAGNLATSADFAFTTLPPADTTPPVISAVASSEVTGSGATITWTTDEASDSQVEYGTTTAYGSASALDTRMLTSHSVALSGLAAGTEYHYRVKSRDAAGNLASSPDFVFTAGTAPRSVTNPRIADFNGDGYADVFLYDSSTGSWSLMLGSNGNGFAAASKGSWAPGLTIYSADLDGNGMTDLFLSDGATGHWSKAISDGAGNFTVSSGGDYSPGASAYLADFGGNERTDIFAYGATTGDWNECLNDGAAGFTCYSGRWSPGLQVSVADLNGDGRADIFAYDPATGAWYQYLATTPGNFLLIKGFWNPGLTLVGPSANAPR